MEVTEVRVSLREEEVLKALVTITLDDVFVVRGLKVIQGSNGLFVAMPARKRRDGTFQDIAHPINREARRYLEGVILTAYDNADGLEGVGVPAPLAPEPPRLVDRAARVFPADDGADSDGHDAVG